MLRSRRKGLAADEDADDADDNSRGHSKDHLSNALHQEQENQQQQPLVPIWAQIAIVVTFLTLGFGSEHYKKSRDIDPFHAHRSMILQNHLQQETANSLGTSLLSPEDDEHLERDSTGQRYHLIFSTDCSPYQHWQSYLVYFTAMRVRQPGHVTQIASGCTPDEADALKTYFRDNVQYMSQRFHVHFTPKFSEVKDESGKVIGDYKFFNKPHGLKHFLEHFEMLGYHGSGSSFDHEDDIVILIDPDMPLTRPITADFSDKRNTLIAERRKDHVISTRVKRGVPFAQTYGLGTQWQNFDLDEIAGPNSPAKDVNHEDGQLYFPVGPPYIGTVYDMHQISLKWTEFVPKVHAQYPHLLAEMYAFCIAAAHLGLRHQLIDSLMASNPDTGGEAWPLIDKIPPTEMCEFGKSPDLEKYALPSVIHLCQRYSVGEEWFFGKRKIPHDIYECETPLFIEPPNDIALKYDFKKPPNAKERTPLSKRVIKQHTFMVCFLTSLLNEAAVFYKENACSEGTGNLNRSRRVADLFTEFQDH